MDHHLFRYTNFVWSFRFDFVFEKGFLKEFVGLWARCLWPNSGCSALVSCLFSLQLLCVLKPWLALGPVLWLEKEVHFAWSFSSPSDRSRLFCALSQPLGKFPQAMIRNTLCVGIMKMHNVSQWRTGLVGGMSRFKQRKFCLSEEKTGIYRTWGSSRFHHSQPGLRL